MVLYVFWYEDFKNFVNFFYFDFFPTFWKNLNFDFFSKIYFLIKISENLSKYCIYECLQIKNKKNSINAIGNAAKRLLNLSRVLRGKLTLGPPLKNLQQRINGGRHFLSLVVLILNTYGG